MSGPPPDLLQAILRPLKFASRSDNIAVVRNLEPAVRAGLDRAEGAVDAERLQQALSLADGLDGLSPKQKRARVEQLIELLDGSFAQGSGSDPGPSGPGAERRAARKSETKNGSGDSRPSAPRRTPARRMRAAAPAPASEQGPKPLPTRRIAMVQAPLDTPITHVTGVGPKTAERLVKKGVETLHDLLFFLPRGYENRSVCARIAELEAGQRVSVAGEVLAASVRPAGRGRRILEAVIGDGTGRLVLRFFRFRRTLLERFPVGGRIRVAGAVTRFGSVKQIVHPELDVGEDSNAKGWIPVYGEVEGVAARTMRGLLQRVAVACAPRVQDPLPDAIRERWSLPNLSDALLKAHVPGDDDGEEALEAMRSRLVFDELLLLQLALGTTRRRREKEPGLAQAGAADFDDLARTLFPFQLTGAQRRASDEIAADLESSRPMSRLLLGDVGSGKTAVAMLMAAAVRRAGRQTALLAPTEVLAEQHHANARRYLEPKGYRVAMLSGSTSTKSRAALVRWLQTQDVDLVIGTHALLEPDVRFRDLGLVIIDEQHRFGVGQRKRLLDKREGQVPDLLVMTATPIPRTLALTAYGDLQVSVIDELPPGRQPSVTELYLGDQAARAYTRVDEALAGGHQAYVVFPLVDVSEKMDLKAATEAADHLRERFPNHAVGLLHGKMKSDEKSEVMGRFARNELQVLVSTTVIEVGVDVPNATVMVIEEADRFGLSQLHQLRGRVGRGGHRGVCCLVSERAGGGAHQRLQVLVETSNGFEVAERDLELRGPGEMLGTRQSGLPDLALADLVRDAHVVERAREQAMTLLEADPDLQSHLGLRAEMHRRFRHRLALADVG